MGKRRTQSLIDSNSSDSDSDADNNLESVSDSTKVAEQIVIRAQPPMSCEEGMIDAIAKKSIIISALGQTGLVVASEEEKEAKPRHKRLQLQVRFRLGLGKQQIGCASVQEEAPKES